MPTEPSPEAQASEKRGGKALGQRLQAAAKTLVWQFGRCYCAPHHVCQGCVYVIPFLATLLRDELDHVGRERERLALERADAAEKRAASYREALRRLLAATDDAGSWAGDGKGKAYWTVTDEEFQTLEDETANAHAALEPTAGQGKEGADGEREV